MQEMQPGRQAQHGWSPSQDGPYPGAELTRAYPACVSLGLRSCSSGQGTVISVLVIANKISCEVSCTCLVLGGQMDTAPDGCSM